MEKFFKKAINKIKYTTLPTCSAKLSFFIKSAKQETNIKIIAIKINETELRKSRIPIVIVISNNLSKFRNILKYGKFDKINKNTKTSKRKAIFFL